MKKGGILVFFIWIFAFILVSNVYSANSTGENFTVESQNVDLRAAYDWLYEQMNSSDWDRSSSEVALALLALRGKGYKLEDGIDKLRDLESDDNWGDVRSSALATLALYEHGKDVDDEIEWLISQQELARDDGLWYIQLSTNYAGTCNLRYDGETYTFQVNGSNNEISSDFCGVSNWIDFEDCVKGGSAGINESIDVNCVIGVNPSIIYNLDNGYYIVDQGDPLNIENGCFEDAGSCNCLVSGYVGWVLEEVESESLIIPYMKSSCGDDPTGNAFLYILTGEEIYKEWLFDKQFEDGSWDGNLRSTYLSLLALKKHGRLSGSDISSAENWVKFFQDEDGSWNGNIEDTSFILYALYGSSYVPSSGGSGGSVCGDYLVEDLEECEYQSDCNVTEGYSCVACQCVLSNATLPQSQCGDRICTPGLETCSNCALDCGECSDGATTCPAGEEFDPVTGTCKKSTSWLKWLFMGLAVLLGVAIIYFVYLKFIRNRTKKGGDKGPYGFGSQRPPYRMSKQNIPTGNRPVQQPGQFSERRDSKMEKELDESLKKARELLKK